MRQMMQDMDDSYTNRSWRVPASLLDEEAMIAHRDYISRLPLGNRPIDVTHGLNEEGVPYRS